MEEADEEDGADVIGDPTETTNEDQIVAQNRDSLVSVSAGSDNSFIKCVR